MALLLFENYTVCAKKELKLWILCLYSSKVDQFVGNSTNIFGAFSDIQLGSSGQEDFNHTKSIQICGVAVLPDGAQVLTSASGIPCAPWLNPYLADTRQGR